MEYSEINNLLDSLVVNNSDNNTNNTCENNHDNSKSKKKNNNTLKQDTNNRILQYNQIFNVKKNLEVLNSYQDRDFASITPVDSKYDTSDINERLSQRESFSIKPHKVPIFEKYPIMTREINKNKNNNKN